MNLDKLVAVSGMSGIYKMVANRKNGLVLENIDTNKRNFYTTRKYQFTPLESISIYTYGEETVELKDVFQKMKDTREEIPIVAPKSSPEVLREYFEQILENYDREKVYISDIKRLIKWFNFLDARDLLEAVEEENEEVEAVEGEENTENSNEEPSSDNVSNED
jgi:uncharacterized protein YcaQ